MGAYFVCGGGLTGPFAAPIAWDHTHTHMMNTLHQNQVHCLFAGVDHVLFPELVNGPIPLTNARGLFSSSLAEYGILVRFGCSVTNI